MEGEVRNNKIVDYISGQLLNGTPEEVEAVQVFARQLVEDYNYPKDLIQTRPQFRVKARPSDTIKEFPVDIAVFRDENKNDNNLEIVVECKKKDRKDGISQLEDYLRFSRAGLGVWFNGEERRFLKKVEKEGKVLFEEIPNIPMYGQRVEDIGLFKRKELKKPHNLRLIFYAIRNHLAGNTVGATRDEELAKQLINVIFCKIFDEKFTEEEKIVSFRAGVDEDSLLVQKRIEELFEKVKGKYSEVIDFSEKIQLDSNSLVYIVGELQNYCLIDAERDVIADAFEVFISGALKGGQGQFFTPRNVIQLMVEFINPAEDDLVIDPACGSGGFLVETLRHKWKLIEKKGKSLNWSPSAVLEEKLSSAITTIHGIEKDTFLSKVAKAYMAILGDGKGGIFCEDSLEIPQNWNNKTQQKISLGRFDVVLTNPPFGKDIKITGKEKLSQFKLAHQWKKKGEEFEIGEKIQSEGKPDILFIERGLQLLKDGGRMGIILPETFFHAPKAKYVIEFLKKNNNIVSIIDLPHNTFRPHNNAKCLIVFVEKAVPQQKKILLGVAEEMGHDHLGKPIFRWDKKSERVDKDSLWDDVKSMIDDLKSNNLENSEYLFNEDSQQIFNRGILVPRYYWKTKEEQINDLAKSMNVNLVSLQEMMDKKIIKTFDGHGSPPSVYKGMGNIPYIRVKDIVNWEIYKDPTAMIPEHIYLRKRGNNKMLQKNDIAYVRRGSYRIGSVAILGDEDTEVLATREILFLRVLKSNNEYNLSPYYLLFLLSHQIVQLQSFNKVLIETTLPNIADRWKELKLPISNDKRERERISSMIEKIINKKREALVEIQELKDLYGSLTT